MNVFCFLSVVLINFYTWLDYSQVFKLLHIQNPSKSLEVDSFFSVITLTSRLYHSVCNTWPNIHFLLLVDQIAYRMAIRFFYSICTSRHSSQSMSIILVDQCSCKSRQLFPLWLLSKIYFYLLEVDRSTQYQHLVNFSTSLLLVDKGTRVYALEHFQLLFIFVLSLLHSCK